MQLFTCPFCGPRPETEFHFGGDAGNIRPGAEASDTDWTDYLFFRTNRKGPAREIWMHLSCREAFLMERDTVSHAVTATHALGGEA